MELVRQCALCRECEGAAYQSPPMLYAGSLNAPIMMLAQNPGEIHSSDKFRLAMGAAMLSAASLDNSGPFLHAWYNADYGSSGNASAMSEVFGPDWMTSGRYLYTNAVRCRTEKNAVPSPEMLSACSTWSRKLYLMHKRKGVILLGNVAALQFLGRQADKLPTNTYKRHPRFGLVLRLTHPSTWRSRETIDTISYAVGNFLTELGGSDEAG